MTTAKLIIGHGAEKTQPFEARKRMPPGYTLVTYAQCGSVTTSDTVAKLVNAFSNPANKDILENPASNKLELKYALNGLDTHVYTEGMYYPEATLYLFAYWITADEVKNIQQDNQIVVTKSGVYEFPLHLDTWTLRQQPGNYTEKSMFTTVDLTGKRTGYRDGLTIKNAEELTTKSYTDSIFPTPAEAAAIAARVNNKVEKFVQATKYSLETIFERGGPGVYYHFVCREPMDTGLSYYVETFGENAGIPNYNKSNYGINSVPTLMPYMKAFAEQRHERLKKNIKREYPRMTNSEIAAIANNLRNSPNNKHGLTEDELYSLLSWNYRNIVNAPTKYQRAYNMIHSTRRKSINQQANRKGGRRTCRRCRKYRKLY